MGKQRIPWVLFECNKLESRAWSICYHSSGLVKRNTRVSSSWFNRSLAVHSLGSHWYGVLKDTPFSKKPRNKKSLNESLTWLLSNFLIVLTIRGSGADPGFFLGGGTLVSCSTSTPIIVFFFCRISVVLENRRPSQGGGVRTPCNHPLDPPRRFFSGVGWEGGREGRKNMRKAIPFHSVSDMGIPFWYYLRHLV